MDEGARKEREWGRYWSGSEWGTVSMELASIGLVACVDGFGKSKTVSIIVVPLELG